MSRGHTLIELAFVLTLLAAGASVSAPAARKWSDRSAVVIAREEVVAALLEARTLAVTTGGGSVTFIARPASFRFDTDYTVGKPEMAGWDGTVSMQLGAGSDSVTIRFDASTWFLDDNGLLFNPATASTGEPNESRAEENIQNSIKVFEDKDKDGDDLDES